MSLSVCLFGKFQVFRDGHPLGGFEALRVRELFSYLLLFHGRPHTREHLVRDLWGNEEPARGLRSLRQALWQLHRALPAQANGPITGPDTGPLLRVRAHDVELHLTPGVELDTATFEEAWTRAHAQAGPELDADSARSLERAAHLYTGELLEGWEQEWCLFERERLHNLHLAVLDRLMAYHEARQDLDTALRYGLDILRHDEAREQTHRRLMRLYWRLGRRPEALRQYERCVQALKRELDALPDRQTRALYDQIRLGETGLLPVAGPGTPPRLPSEEVGALIMLVEQVQAALYRLRAAAQFPPPRPPGDPPRGPRGQEEPDPS